jgi:hypothetical protein
MLSSYSQWSPQGFMPQFSGQPGIGPQLSPGFTGQTGAYGGNAQFGHEHGQFAQSPLLLNALTHNPFAQASGWGGPYAVNPYAQIPLQTPYAAYQLANSSFGQQGVVGIQQLAPVLGYLAQQLAARGMIEQQIGLALHQLVQHLAVQASYGRLGAEIGAAQHFAGLGFGGPGQPFVPGFNPGPGFNPAGPGWGASRPQTIQ